MTPPVPTNLTTATPSLQRRVSIIVVGLLTLLLIILGVVVDVSLDVQARRNLHDRLVAATSRADALVAAHTTPEPDRRRTQRREHTGAADHLAGRHLW